MKLNQAIIRNYRSIDTLDLSFNNNLNIFVGKNESGKSNIIKAISQLSPNIKTSKDDTRETLPDEQISKYSLIWFAFETSEKEQIDIYDKLKSHFDSEINIEQKFIQDGENLLNLKEFCMNRRSVMYTCSISAERKYYSDWSFDDINKKVLKNIVKRTSKSDNENTTKFFEVHEIDMEKDEEVIKVSDINTLITSYKIALLKANHPEVLYWSYSEENLLPSEIDITEFANDPEICIPLKNLFYLAGIDNIKKSVTEARDSSPNKYRNFLNKIAEHATNHFVSIWKEYKHVSFILEPNGDKIETGIRERNIYTFQQRSDGFKRFITFLLMVSVSAKNQKLKNSVILVDEPDVSLHPSGIRYLREELKKISSNNIVVVATHSIFMIDGQNMNDYYIVNKENEKTTIEKPTEKNIAAEEVLYRALDFSIYELLKDYNILFEGWRDKKLFQTALSKSSPELKTFFSKIGVSHTSGVRNVKNITPIFELAGKKCIIVSDSDKAAKEKQKEFKKDQFFGTWLRYDEIDIENLAVTGEDFLTESYIKKGIKHFEKSYPDIKGNPEFNNNRGIISNINQWLKNEGLSPELTNTYIDNLKTYLFENIKNSDINQSYYIFLSKLEILIKPEEQS